jgi:hypothetical protein
MNSYESNHSSSCIYSTLGVYNKINSTMGSLPLKTISKPFTEPTYTPSNVYKSITQQTPNCSGYFNIQYGYVSPNKCDIPYSTLNCNDKPSI